MQKNAPRGPFVCWWLVWALAVGWLRAVRGETNTVRMGIGRCTSSSKVGPSVTLPSAAYPITFGGGSCLWDVGHHPPRLAVAHLCSKCAFGAQLDLGHNFKTQLMSSHPQPPNRSHHQTPTRENGTATAPRLAQAPQPTGKTWAP